MLEHEVPQPRHRRTRQRPLGDVPRQLRLLDHVVHERVDPRRAALPEDRDRLSRQLLLAQQSRPHRVVDVVVDVGHPVDHPHDPTLQGLRTGRPRGVPGDPLAHLLGQVQTGPVALQALHDPQRVLVVAEVPPEALFQAPVEDLLADVPERWMPEVVSQADRLHQVLVQPQRSGHRPRDRGHLQRVGQPRPVVIAPRRHEHLRLVRQPPKGLAVHDPVAVALEGGAQGAVRLLALADSRVRAGGKRREQPLLLLAPALREGACHEILLTGEAHPWILPARTGRDRLSARDSSRCAR